MSDTESSAGQIEPIPATSTLAGWKPVGWAVFWCIGVSLAALGASFLLGLALGYFGLRERMGQANFVAVALIVSSLVSFGALIAVALWRARREDGRDLWAELRHAPLQNRWLIWLAVPLLSVFSFSLSGTDWEPYPDLTRHLLQVRPLLLLVGALVVSLLGPVAEELFFRGWLWTALRRRWSVLPTAIVTSTLWLAMHFGHGASYILLLLPSAVGGGEMRPPRRGVGATATVPILDNGPPKAQ
ncbi:MAG: type II CAAX endopeptidase family protein, partial [Ferrovibrio sp.]